MPTGDRGLRLSPFIISVALHGLVVLLAVTVFNVKERRAAPTNARSFSVQILSAERTVSVPHTVPSTGRETRRSVNHQRISAMPSATSAASSTTVSTQPQSTEVHPGAGSAAPVPETPGTTTTRPPPVPPIGIVDLSGATSRGATDGSTAGPSGPTRPIFPLEPEKPPIPPSVAPSARRGEILGKDIAKATRPDCASKYAATWLLAIPLIATDYLRDRGCRFAQ